MKHGKFILKILCFIIIAGLTIGMVNTVLTPKYLYDNTWPTTQTVEDFYDIDKDSIDVLFLGSSCSVSAFSPIYLYEKYQIRSYSISTEQQNLLVSYYWLKEALKYQSPEVVILETYLLFPFNEEEALNADEGSIRKSIDYMRWSKNKQEAIKDICKIDESQDELSYYLTNIRFHTRWADLNEDDFTYGIFSSHSSLMGYSALNDQCGIYFKPFEVNRNMGEAQPVKIMQEYLDKIVQLCSEENIKLILTKTPSTTGNVRKYNYLINYATENGIEYIDFNEKSLYEEINYDFAIDNHDDVHINFIGAEKVTDYIGKTLTGKYGIEPTYSAEHEKLLDYYSEIKKDCSLKYIDDIYDYLDLLNDNRYAVFISVKGDGIASLDDNLKQKLYVLGVTEDLDYAYGESYYIVINGDTKNEAISKKKLSSKGTIRNGRVIYSISSAGINAGDSSSIKINDTEYSIKGEGMNFVVYCLDTKKVIDSVCFNTNVGLQATR